MNLIFSKIIELHDELKKFLPLSKEIRDRLDRKFRLEFNFNSNHLEGNTLTYGETELLLIFDETTGNHSFREYEEMQAHDVAFRYIKELASDQERSLSEHVIRELNKIILVKPFWKDTITQDGHKSRKEIKVGIYKETPNHVRLSNGEIFEYASVTDTPIKMDELLRWYHSESKKKEIHPIELAALLHYKFVCIHPFDDGNGRISRLIMNYVLLKNGFPPVIIKSSEKKEYLLALHQADIGNQSAFTEYISKQMIWSLEVTLKAAKGESIEEKTDLEKEITLFKSKIKQKHNKPERNGFLIHSYFSFQIKTLFTRFQESLSSFNELFSNNQCTTFLNGRFSNSINELGASIEDLVFSKEITNVSKTDLKILDSVFNFSIEYKLIDYKYLNSNKFSIVSKLIFIFNLFDFQIEYAEKKIVKDYSEQINPFTKDELDHILYEIQKSVFEEIKSKTDPI